MWGSRNLLLLRKLHHLYKVREKQLWAAFEWRWLGNCDNFTAVLPAAHFIMCTTFPLQCLSAVLQSALHFFQLWWDSLQWTNVPPCTPLLLPCNNSQQSVNLHETSGVTEKFGFNVGNEIFNMVPNPLREDLINILKNTLKQQVDLVKLGPLPRRRKRRKISCYQRRRKIFGPWRRKVGQCLEKEIFG